MQSAEFNEIVEAKILEIQNTLLKKGKEYAPGADTDRLANFRKAAHLQGINMKQALQGMQAKHIVSIADMIASGEDYPQEVWDEKIGDALVYFLLLTTVVIEEKSVGWTEDDLTNNDIALPVKDDVEVPAGSFRTFYNANELNKYAADRDYLLFEVPREQVQEGDLVLWSEEKGSYFVYRPMNKESHPFDEAEREGKEDAARFAQYKADQGGTDAGSNKIEFKTIEDAQYIVFKTLEDAKRHYPGKKIDVEPIHWLTPGKSIFVGDTHYHIES